MSPASSLSLPGIDKRRVGLANELYMQCAKIFEHCTKVGILCTIENPGNSYFWSTTYMTELAVGYNDVFLHVWIGKEEADKASG